MSAFSSFETYSTNEVFLPEQDNHPRWSDWMQDCDWMFSRGSLPRDSSPLPAPACAASLDCSPWQRAASPSLFMFSPSTSSDPRQIYLPAEKIAVLPTLINLKQGKLHRTSFIALPRKYPGPKSLPLRQTSPESIYETAEFNPTMWNPTQRTSACPSERLVIVNFSKKIDYLILQFIEIINLSYNTLNLNHLLTYILMLRSFFCSI